MKNLFLVLTLVCGVAFLQSCGSSGGGNFTLKGAGSSASAHAALAKSSRPLPTVTGANPADLKVKVYKFAVSTHGDCSSPITVYSNANPAFTNLLDNPTFGSGTVPDGTYLCVIMEMSDNIKFTSLTATTNCNTTTESTADVCRADDNGTSTLLDGTAVTCTGSHGGGTVVLGDDHVALYLTTISTSDGSGGGNAFAPPTAGATTTGDGLKLASPLVVAGAATGFFIVDADGKVDSEGGSQCGMAAPVFSFQ